MRLMAWKVSRDRTGRQGQSATCVPYQCLDEPVRRVDLGLDVGLGAMAAQLLARRRADRDEARAVERARGLREEAHGARAGEGGVVGAERGRARVAVER